MKSRTISIVCPYCNEGHYMIITNIPSFKELENKVVYGNTEELFCPQCNKLFEIRLEKIIAKNKRKNIIIIEVTKVIRESKKYKFEV